MSLVLAALSSLCYGVGDFAGGFAARRSRVMSVLAVSQSAGLVLAAVFVALGLAGAPSVSALAFGGAAGVFGTVGLCALYDGIGRGSAGIVSPVAALVGAAIPVLFGFALGERPGPTSLVGMGLCLPAILLLSMERVSGRGAEARRAVLTGLVASAGFGGFVILVSRTAPESGIWPVIAARCVSVGIVLAVNAAKREAGLPARESLPWAVGAGILDMGANMLFLLSTRLGYLSLASIVMSLFPAPTVILSWLVFRDRPALTRIAGLALSLAGVALIALK